MLILTIAAFIIWLVLIFTKSSDDEKTTTQGAGGLPYIGKSELSRAMYNPFGDVLQMLHMCSSSDLTEVQMIHEISTIRTVEKDMVNSLCFAYSCLIYDNKKEDAIRFTKGHSRLMGEITTPGTKYVHEQYELNGDVPHGARLCTGYGSNSFNLYINESLRERIVSIDGHGEVTYHN